MEKLTVTMAARFTETEREEILAMAGEFDEGEIRAVRSGISEQMRMFFLYVRSRIARGTLQWTRDALQELLSEPCEHDLQRAFKFGPQKVRAAFPECDEERLATGTADRTARRPLRFSVSPFQRAKELAFAPPFTPTFTSPQFRIFFAGRVA